MTVALVPVGFEHAEAIQRLASDPAIGATTNVPVPYPEDGAQRWIQSRVEAREAETDYAFAVVDEERQVVGVVTLMSVDRGAQTAGLGYWIGVPFWSKGYATQAAHACIAFGESLGIERVEAVCLEANQASRRVLEKAGFRVRGAGKPEPRGAVLAYEWRASFTPSS
ncbi:MAG: GNAT family N-acetyltransferase [Bacteroidota bacterium]